MQSIQYCAKRNEGENNIICIVCLFSVCQVEEIEKQTENGNIYAMAKVYLFCPLSLSLSLYSYDYIKDDKSRY